MPIVTLAEGIAGLVDTTESGAPVGQHQYGVKGFDAGLRVLSK